MAFCASSMCSPWNKCLLPLIVKLNADDLWYVHTLHSAMDTL